jgi:hypothetical protein
MGSEFVKRHLTPSLALPALLLLLANVALAADALVLNGRVTDENGLPVGGAQIKLENPAGQVSSASSDDAGYFSLPNLSPGQYSVHIEKPGFFLMTGHQIELAPDSTDFVFALNHEEEVHEKVEVTARENPIEPAATPATTNLSADEIRDIPVSGSHNLQESLVAMPQVVRDNSALIHLAGARNTQALYLIDGFEVGDPASNALGARMVVEAVRSTELQTARFGAEYAHPGAAVLNYETREGDDHWRFNTTDFIPGVNLEQGVQLGNYYPRMVFSGPIVKDRLWFSQSFDVIHTLSIEKGLPAGQDEVKEWGGDSWTRLLWKISSNNSLHASFLSNVERDSNLGLDPLHPISTTTDQTENQAFGSVKEQSYIHSTLLEFGAAFERTTGGAFPHGSAPYVVEVNGTLGDYFQNTHDLGHRYQAFTNATGAPLHWLGTHTISAGGNLSSVDFSQTATRTEIQSERADGTLDRLTTFAGSPQVRVANTLAGAFVQDSWSFNPHVVASLGARVDWDRLFQAALVQPRLAVNILPFADNRSKFSAGWGEYDIPLNLYVIGQAYDQQQIDTFYDPTGTVPIGAPVISRFLAPAGGLTQLQQPYFDTSSVGYQQKIGDNTLVSLELLVRNQHHGLDYQTIPQGTLGWDYLLETSRQDRYRGATFTARHTFANKAVLFGSYTRSRANSGQVFDPALGTLYFTPQQPGPLAWDAPNRFLSWGTIPTPIWGILLTYLFDEHTGYPYSVVNQQQFLVGPPNAARFPNYACLIIGLEKRFTFRDRVFAARISLVNALDRSNPDSVVNNMDAPNFGTFAGGQGLAVTGRLRLVGRK